jgi:lysophospholipase L1-like esterase
LAPELERQFGAYGIRVVTISKDGTHLPYWGGRFSALPGLIQKYAPGLVVINLGGNDAIIKDPSDRPASIERLVEHVGATPCVWVAPSMWQPDNGVLAMIREHSAPCRYFDTDAVVPGLSRDTRDPIHPSLGARRRWAEALIGWLARERDPHGRLPFSLRPEAAAR